MMESNAKLQIYKGMIQYLLESTNYNLKNIADLTNSSIKIIQSIHCAAVIPDDFSSELQLVKLYHIILESNKNTNRFINKSIAKNKAQQINCNYKMTME